MNELALFNIILENELETEKPITAGQLKEHIDLSSSTIHRYLSGLIKFGYLYRVSRGVYAVDCVGLRDSIDVIYQRRVGDIYRNRAKFVNER
jgi:predicted transcriptional regulator of viral defense system